MRTNIKIVLEGESQDARQAVIILKGVPLAVASEDVCVMIREEGTVGRYLFKKGWSDQAYWLVPSAIRVSSKGLEIILDPDIIQYIVPGSNLRFGLSFDRKTFVVGARLTWTPGVAGKSSFAGILFRNYVAVTTTLVIVLSVGWAVYLYFSVPGAFIEKTDGNAVAKSKPLAGDVLENQQKSELEQENGKEDTRGKKKQMTQVTDSQSLPGDPAVDERQAPGSSTLGSDHLGVNSGEEKPVTPSDSGNEQAGKSDAQTREQVAPGGDPAMDTSFQKSAWETQASAAGAISDRVESAAAEIIVPDPKHSTFDKKDAPAERHLSSDRQVSSSTDETTSNKCDNTAKKLLENYPQQEEAFEEAEKLETSGCVGQAFLVYKNLAKAGLAAAMTALARRYDPALFGKVPTPLLQPNAQKALEWYQRSAKLGDPDGIEGLQLLRNSMKEKAIYSH